MSIVRRVLAGATAIGVVLGLGLAGAVAPAAAAPDDAELLISKSVDPDTSPYDPGEQFSYTITLICNSNLVDTCIAAQVTDTLPAPLIFDESVANPVVVIGGGSSDVNVDDDTFTVDFTQGGAAGVGLEAGEQVSITVYVQVDQDASADLNGRPIVNTAAATAENALPVDGSATITVAVPVELDSTVQKSVDDHQPGAAGIPALPGQPVDYEIGGGNASNRSVDAIVVQDPADGVASPFDGYLDFTGITSVTPPAGADQVQVEVLDADGNWNVAYPTGPIPADASSIPGVEPPSDVKGLRFTFSSSTGQLPPTPDGGGAVIGIGAETNDTVESIPLDGSVTVPNTASSSVVLGDETTPPKTAPGEVVISNTGPFVDVEKSFLDPTLLAGEQTTAFITATNGFRPVTEMVIHEPTPGSPNLAEQGLQFDGWGPAVVWPPNATGATVTFTYADGTSATLPATAPDTLPDPTGEVVGFTVAFTGPIISNAAADLPFEVTALPVEGQQDVVNTNDTTSIVTDQTGKTGDDQDSADLTRQPARVSTVIEKNIARDELWAVPGTSTDVTWLASVNGTGANASTVGSEYLIVSDPPNPQPSDPPTEFWNTFDAAQVVAGVPANADLQVEYWNGTSWVPLPGGQLDGAGTLTATIPDDLKDEIEGIRFVYTPKPGELLPPGFQVAPNVTVETRDEFRDGSGSVADAAAAADPLTVANTAQSSVDNPDDTSPEDNTAQAGDQTNLVPVPDGDLPDLLEKAWLPDEPLFAFSEGIRTARISWATEGFPFDTVAITDDPTAGAAYDDTSIQASAFDAWNLFEIAPIDAALDPAMRFDRVASVELFDGDTGEWVDITDAACGPGGDACDGAFPGYTLTAAERASTRAVRIEYAEGSGRGVAGAPPVGSGVAPSYGFERNLDLRFELRDAKRSDGGPVTGSLHDETYNTGQAGVVRNTAGLVGVGPAPADQSDDHLITILDSTINVQVSKTFDQEELPLPPAGTPQSSYPLVGATITAVNETEASIETLSVADPAPGSSTTAYEYLDLYSIDSVSVPDFATASTVTLTREGGAQDPPIPLADAYALTPGELADVIGISVLHTDPTGVEIASEASTSVHLTFQLREFERSAPGVRASVADVALNVAGVEGTRPGGDPALDVATGSDDDSIAFVNATYGVAADKAIAPASRYEDEPRDGYLVTLTGQPTGNVRTTVLTVTDEMPTFWNAFALSGFPAITLSPNLHQLRVSALVGVDYVVVGGALAQTCGGDPDLTACWQVGDWLDVTGSVTPDLREGVDAAEVRGIRFEVRRDAAGSNWEAPVNPIVTVAFEAERLEFLRLGSNGEVDSVPVPSTLPGSVPAPGETSAGTISDQVDVHGEGSWIDPESGLIWEADANAFEDTLLQHRVNAIRVEKAPGNGQDGAASQQFPPGASIPYRMRITNTGEWSITGLELSDQVGTDAQGSYLIPQQGVDPVFGFRLTDAGGAVLDSSGFSGSLDTSTGLVTITVPPGFALEPGDVLLISAALVFRPGLPPGTPVANTITASSDRDFETCDFTHLNRPAGEPVQNTATCAADTVVNPSAAAPIGIVKAVKGVGAGEPGAPLGDPNHDDLGVLSTTGDAAACAMPNAGLEFYANTCVPITRPGGTERWRVTFTNRGNIASEAIAAIDVLPAVGDTGVVVSTARGSQWSPIFLGNISVPLLSATGGALTTYYLTTVPDRACNATDIQFSARGTLPPTTDPCYADVSTRAWIPFTNATDSAALAQAKALKVVADFAPGQGLQPGGVADLYFDTQTPFSNAAVVDGALPIAWNAVAAGSLGTTNTGAQVYQGPVEPVRSGVAVPTGEVELQKQLDLPEGWNFPLPGTYAFDVQCTSGGQPVNVVTTGGAPLPPVSVPADGTPTRVGSATNIPLYAECTVQELTSQGSTVTYEPPGVEPRSGELTALRTFEGRADIAHPFDTAPLVPEHVIATNAYQLGGFSVTKVVDPSSAVDQDGEPIASDPEFTFTADCRWLGQNVVPEADRTFTLHDGDVKDFSALPVGATCTVQEIGDGGATTTGLVVTEEGIAGTSEPTARFTVLPDDDGAHVTAVTATNVFTVGGLAITKAVTGSGAGGAPDDFRVRLVCTWEQATTNPVYDDTVAISDGETWTVGNLPTGASCTATEPADGGATEVTINPNPVVVGDTDGGAEPIAVSVTNAFRTGGFVVEKTIVGAGVGFSEDVQFVFGYACTYDGEDVVSGELSITGDGTTGPLRSGIVGGLPVDTECTVTEIVDGGADATPPPVTVTIPDEEDGIAQVGTAPFENRFTAGTIAVTKVLEGAGADLPEIADASYTVHVTCSLTADGAPIFEGDVQLVGATTVTVLDPATGEPLLLPLGTHCWGEETDDAGATESGVDFGSFDDAVIVTATEDDDPQALGITATNVFDVGDLVIEKELGGNPDHAAGFTFEILVTCTLDRGDGNPPVVVYDQEPVELQGGGSATLGDIPIGSECYAEEPDPQGATQVDISATADAPIIIDGAGDITITVANVYPDAGFVVTKTVDNGGAVDQDGDPIRYEAEFSFIAQCTFQGATVLDESFTLIDGQTQTYDTLPAGSECLVEETDQGGATTSMVLTQGGTSSDLGDTTTAEFTLLPDADDAAVTTVAVANHYTVGAVQITKEVTGTGADAWGGTFGDFEVRLVCTLAAADPDVVYDATHTLAKDAPGDVWLVENLPTGAGCDITETDDGGATDGVVDPSSVVIGAGAADPVLVTVTNDFRTGGLNVLKQVTGPGVPTFSDGPFTFGVVCTYEGETVVDQQLVVTGDGTAGPFTSETITGIPVDSECIVTELDDGGADDTPPPVTVTIEDQEPEGVETVVTAGFLNAFSLGTVEIAKVVDGEAADEPYVTDAVFTVRLTCQIEIQGELVTLFDGPVEVRAGERSTVVDADGDPVKLPYTTHCFGTEVDAAGASGSVVDFDSYENAAVVDVEDEPQLLTITATNTFDLGSLELRKTISGAASEAAGKTFVVALTCTLDRGGNEPYVALDAEPVRIRGGETQTIDGLPIGAECWAEETENGGAVAVRVSATAADPVTVGAGDEPTVRITVDNAFAPPIPSTGVDGIAVALWVGAGIVLLAGGAVLLLVRRRRRDG